MSVSSGPSTDILEGQERFRKAFLLLFTLGVTAAFVAMVRQFLVTILLAAIFTGLLTPLYRRLVALARGRRTPAAALTVLLMILGFIVPVLTVLGIVVAEAVRISHTAGPWIQNQIEHPDTFIRWIERLPFLDDLQLSSAEILTKVGTVVSSIGSFVVSGLSAATKMTVSFLFKLVLFIYTVFYFLLDGEKLLRRILLYIPLGPEDERRMLRMFLSVSRATFKGVLFIGLAQGILAGGALAVAGVPSAVFWGTLMVVLSMIPGAGTGFVWLPASIYLIATDRVAAGIGVMLFCALVVGSLDNVLRPRLVGRDAQMHSLLILFSILGGLILFGMVGLLLGPILGALLVIVWDIYAVVFRDVLPEVGGAGRDSQPAPEAR